ncbi:hypothetical protein H8356DRAFT_1428619 [Neocallimastix lanati (nom. inval.)]|nr:hypothetical protein H8356DRAFT_1428619 [Neocallimastix sp. JGI-2020a]
MKLNFMKFVFLFSYILSFYIANFLKIKGISSLDAYYKKDEIKTLNPVVIFYHGENNYTDVIPNDDLFPFGNPNRIIVSGHSYGTHLLILTLFKTYNKMTYDGITFEPEPLPTLKEVLLISAIFKEKAEIDEVVDQAIVPEVSILEN